MCARRGKEDGNGSKPLKPLDRSGANPEGVAGGKTRARDAPSSAGLRSAAPGKERPVPPSWPGSSSRARVPPAGETGNLGGFLGGGGDGEEIGESKRKRRRGDVPAVADRKSVV